MYRNIIPVLFLFFVVALDSTAHEVDTWVDQNDLTVEVRGTVRYHSGKAVPKANVRFVDPRRILDDEYKPVVAATDEEGGFSLKYNVVDAFRHPLIAETNDREWIGCYCFHFEVTEGARPLSSWEERKTQINAKGKVRVVPVPDIERLQNISITLMKTSKIRGKVVDDSDKPVHNAWIGSRYLYAHKYFAHIDLTQCRSNENGEFELPVLKSRLPDERFVFHRERGAFFTHSRYEMVEQPPTSAGSWNVRIKRYPTRVRLVDHNTSSPRSDFWVRPLAVNHQLETNSSPFYATPDENGVAHLSWIPSANNVFTFYPGDFRTQSWHHVEEPLEERTITLKNRPVKIYGRMTFPDGKPASKIRLVYHTSLYQTEELNTEAFNQTWTDSDGRYVIDVFSSVYSGSPVDTFELYLFPDIDGWVPNRLPTLRFPAGGKPVRFDLGLRKPTVIRGTVTRNHAQQGHSPEEDIELRLTGSLYSHWFMSGSTVKTETWIQKTDENGNFRFEVGPGFYSLRGTGVWKSDITVEAQEEIVIASETAYRNMTGTVVDVSRDKQPVADAKVGYPVFANTFSFNTEIMESVTPSVATTDEHGRFSFENLTPSHEMFLAVKTAAKNPESLYGFVRTDSSVEKLTIPVAPMQTVRGRLVKEDDKTPLAGYEYALQAVTIHEDREGPDRIWDMEFPLITGKTSLDGSFQSGGLVFGVDYSLRLKPKDVNGAEIKSFFVKEDEVAAFRIDKAEEINLGTVSVSPDAYYPSGFQMHSATLLGPFEEDMLKKLEQYKIISKERGNLILVLLTEINFMPHQNFLRTFFENAGVRKYSQHYLLMVRESRRFSKYDEARFAEVAKLIGIDPEKVKQPTLCILDGQGKLLETVPFETLLEHGSSSRHADQTNPEKLIEVLKRHLERKNP